MTKIHLCVYDCTCHINMLDMNVHVLHIWSCSTSFGFAGATDGADAGDPRPAQRAGLAARRAAPSLPRAAGALGQAGEDAPGGEIFGRKSMM